SDLPSFPTRRSSDLVSSRHHHQSIADGLDWLCRCTLPSPQVSAEKYLPTPTTMNKQAIKRHRLTEHYLVPTALFALNIGVVHVIYAYANGTWENQLHLAALTAAPAILALALFLKHRWLLLSSSVGYLILLLCWP